MARTLKTATSAPAEEPNGLTADDLLKAVAGFPYHASKVQVRLGAMRLHIAKAATHYDGRANGLVFVLEIARD